MIFFGGDEFDDLMCICIAAFSGFEIIFLFCVQRYVSKTAEFTYGFRQS